MMLRLPITITRAAASQHANLVDRPSWLRSETGPPAGPATSSGSGPSGTLWLGVGQIVVVRAVEAVLEHATSVGREPGAASHLQLPHLGVTEPTLGTQLGAPCPQRRKAPQIPPPCPGHGNGPSAVAGKPGHDDLAGGKGGDLGQDPQQVEASVALEGGQQLVAALQLLQGRGRS